MKKNVFKMLPGLALAAALFFSACSDGSGSGSDGGGYSGYVGGQMIVITQAGMGSTESGSVTTTPDSYAPAGTTVSVKVTPPSSCKVKSFEITCQENYNSDPKQVSYSPEIPESGGTCTFTMPTAYLVGVKVDFEN